MNFIELECLIIMILSIKILFKIKDWSYAKQNLKNNKMEEYVFLLFMFTSLFLYGYIVEQRFFIILSAAFLYWIIFDAIKFNIELWKMFLAKMR